ncbi:MAG TPA: proton-conducting transporter membrane subunit [Acidobacteriota bacterium]|nr:proton-conducting transporter membrane subunit [Acidobacteriota bacterium]
MSSSVAGVVSSIFVVYLLSALLGLVLYRRRNLVSLINGVGSTLAFVGWCWIGWAVLYLNAGGAWEWHLGSVQLPLLLDGMSALFLGVAGLLGVASGWFSWLYLEHDAPEVIRRFMTAFPLFLAGIAGLLVVDDLSVGFTAAWQVMTLSSYVLIRCAQGDEVRRASNVYLFWMELAWASVSLGAWMLDSWRPGVSLEDVAGALSSAASGTVTVAACFLLLGFAVKAAVFPFGQAWLPGAHSAAPSPVSSLLSGIVIKTGVFGLLRILLWVLPARGDMGTLIFLWGCALAAAGVLTLFLGTVQSLKQSDMKRLLAYSSIGQVGYIVFALGSAAVLLAAEDPWSKKLAVLALAALLYHVVNHAVFKGLLFLISGSVLHATGLRDLNRLGGLLRLMPWTSLLAGFASLAIAGAPATSGFNSKWGIVVAGILAGGDRWPLIVGGIVGLFTSTMTLACYVKFFGMGFASAGVEWYAEKPVREVPQSMLLPKILLAAVCLVQGLFPGLWYGLALRVWEFSPGSVAPAGVVPWDSAGVAGLVGLTAEGEGVAWAVSASWVLLLLITGFVLASWLRRSAGAETREAPTWLGGYQQLNQNNRYLDRGLFSAFRDLMRWTGGEPR